MGYYRPDMRRARQERTGGNFDPSQFGMILYRDDYAYDGGREVYDGARYEPEPAYTPYVPPVYTPPVIQPIDTEPLIYIARAETPKQASADAQAAAIATAIGGPIGAAVQIARAIAIDQATPVYTKTPAATTTVRTADFQDANRDGTDDRDAPPPSAQPSWLVPAAIGGAVLLVLLLD